MADSVIWIGCVDIQKSVEKNSALSPAANDWQLKMLKAIARHSYKVYVISHIPYSAWPKGPLIVKGSKKKAFNESVIIKNKFYINIYLVRDLLLIINTVFSLIAYAKEPKCLFSYNYSIKCLVAGWLWQLMGKKWIAIFADGRDKYVGDKTIYLSCHAYEKSVKKNKIFFDSGIDNNMNCSKKTNVKNIMYAGAISEWTGIYDFVKEFAACDLGIEYILDIYGKGDIEPIKHLIDCVRIRYYGYVDEEVLFNAACSAYAFINPRPGNTDEELNNFPSKISFYLSFGKKVISKKIKNISHEYSEMIDYYDSFDQFIELIKRGDNRDTQSIRKFIEQRSWYKKVSDLLEQVYLL